MNSVFGDDHLLSLWEDAAPLPPARRSLCLLAGLTDSPTTSGTLPAGERDRRLLLVRKQLLGDRIEGVTECPACAARVELSFSVTEVAGDSPQPVLLNPVVSNGYEVRWRLPTSNDLAELAGEAEPDVIQQLLLERCLVEVRHERQVISAAECPPDLIQDVCEAMSQADPFGDTRLDMQCPDCGTSWKALFDIGPYLWKEIDVWARRMLWEVHRLAAAYGWSEKEILAMSARRRSYYLELVES